MSSPQLLGNLRTSLILFTTLVFGKHVPRRQLICKNRLKRGMGYRDFLGGAWPGVGAKMYDQ